MKPRWNRLAETFECVYMYHMLLTKRWTFLAAALLMLLGATAAAQAAELVMFERAGCVWCQRWDREIAPVYGKTTEGRLLPLRRIDVDRQVASDVTLKSPVIYTPTFVVIDNGREIGRISGYINDESFWGLLGRLAATLRAVPEHTGYFSRSAGDHGFNSPIRP